MNNLGKTAKGLAKNPIGIVALFLILIYAIASLFLGISGEALSESQKWPLIWFLIIFPVLILGVFTFLVIYHHEKLYAPSEYRDEKHFFRKLTPEDQKQRLEESVESLISSASQNQLTEGVSRTTFRSLSRGEIKLNISLAEDLALRALEEELRCSIAREVAIPAGNEWVNFDGAVARGEELVAIEVKYYKGGGFPYFQVEHLFEIMASVEFDRFSNASLLIAIVSEAEEDEDRVLESEIVKMASRLSVTVSTRMYRLNLLKAKFGI